MVFLQADFFPLPLNLSSTSSQRERQIDFEKYRSFLIQILNFPSSQTGRLVFYRNTIKMGQPSFAASNAIIYVTYGFFLCVKLLLTRHLCLMKERGQDEKNKNHSELT
jgi:hypothetical protein